VLALLVVAAAVGVSNLAASIGLGVSGVDASTRLRVGLVFGVFEAGMPVVGLLIGRSLATEVGAASHWVGGALLVALGLFGLIRPVIGRVRGGPPATAKPAEPARGLGRLLLSGLALSLDNLVIGFALGTYQTPILLSALVIGAVSVAMSLAGLELGALLGRLARRTRWPDESGDQLGGALLVMVGVAVAAGVLT
jgi:putative Mn2+ efflux pump MntP